MIRSDVGCDFYTPTLSLGCSDLLPAALPLLPAPFFQRLRQTDGHGHGHERSLRAAAVTGKREQTLKRRTDGLNSQPAPPLSGDFTDFLIFKSFYLSFFSP